MPDKELLKGQLYKLKSNFYYDWIVKESKFLEAYPNLQNRDIQMSVFYCFWALKIILILSVMICGGIVFCQKIK